MHRCQHSFSKIPSNPWVVHLGSNIFQKNSYAGKPQVVSRYILSNLWLAMILESSSHCHCKKIVKKKSKNSKISIHFKYFAFQSTLPLTPALWGGDAFIDVALFDSVALYVGALSVVWLKLWDKMLWNFVGCNLTPCCNKLARFTIKNFPAIV